MKTSIQSKIAVAAFILALGAPTYAAQSRMAQGRSNSRNQTDTTAAPASDNSLWQTLGTPFRWAGRAGTTLVRSPMILGETVTGERKVIGKNGMFAHEEETKSEQARASQKHPLFRD